MFLKKHIHMCLHTCWSLFLTMFLYAPASILIASIYNAGAFHSSKMRSTFRQESHPLHFGWAFAHGEAWLLNIPSQSHWGMWVYCSQLVDCSLLLVLQWYLLAVFSVSHTLIIFQDWHNIITRLCLWYFMTVSSRVALIIRQFIFSDIVDLGLY